MLANSSPAYLTYRAMNAARMLAADKEPGVRPLACGEVWMRLISKCIIDGKTKEMARRACCNVPLCAGLQAGIEGNLHAVREVWPESAGWQYNSGTADEPSPTFASLQLPSGDLPDAVVADAPPL